MKASEYKKYKGIRKESLRDNMTDIEVTLTDLSNPRKYDVIKLKTVIRHPVKKIKWQFKLQVLVIVKKVIDLKILLLFSLQQSIISMKSITGNTKEEKMKKDKFVGVCKVGEKGQIVIPKEARDMFEINAGDSITVLCDKAQGIALVKADVIEDLSDKIFPKGVK